MCVQIWLLFEQNDKNSGCQKLKNDKTRGGKKRILTSKLSPRNSRANSSSDLCFKKAWRICCRCKCRVKQFFTLVYWPSAHFSRFLAFELVVTLTPLAGKMPMSLQTLENEMSIVKDGHEINKESARHCEEKLRFMGILK